MSKMKMKVAGTSEGMKTLVKAGKHEIVVDEAEQMAAKEIEFDLQELSIKAEGEFDPRGFMGDSSVRSHFETATLTVEVKTSESEERINELKEMVAARCPVYSTFVAADIKMKDTWTIV